MEKIYLLITVWELLSAKTSEIGNNVTIYHNVTLGGIAPSINTNDQRNTKRHPTLEDNVVVGSGAQILGTNNNW